tara:strand:- start:34619 stop:44518 length:9900 start_codon:yes stop_codon:yes gene_type:complete
MESIRKNTWVKRSVSGWLVFWLSFQPIFAVADIIADPSAGSHRPTVDSAASGAPLVHITTPSAGGVSRNEYTEFSTGANGVFLNNHSVANSAVSSSRGDIIGANPNLIGSGAARVILNEVTSTRRSDLNGDIEVIGSRAEVVVANPNGITCNGCGFINTSRGVLTTGRPLFGGAGSLEAFRVTGGDITIGANGLNAADTLQLDLISQLLDVQGPIWANNLNAIAGRNEVGYEDLNVSPIGGAGAAAAVGIDVASLGGMYANKIHLISNESGVGVNNRGEIGASLSDVTIDASGQLIISGRLSAENNIVVNGGATLENSGTIYARNDVDLSVAGNLTNAGNVLGDNDIALHAASITNAASGVVVATAGDAIILADQAISNAGTIGSSQAEVDIQAGGDISQVGKVAAGSSVYLQGDANINNTGTISAMDGVVVEAAGHVTNNNEISAAGDIAVTASSITNANKIFSTLGNIELDSTSGQLENNGAIETQSTGGAISLSATGDIVQGVDKYVIAAGDLTVATQGAFRNDGDYSSDGMLSVSATGRVINSGFMLGNNGAQIAGDTFANNAGAGLVSTQGSIDVSTRGDIENYGTLYAMQDIVLRALPLGGQVATISNSGDIEAGRSIAMGFDCAMNADTGECTSDSYTASKNVNFTNTGKIKSRNNLYVHATNFDNNISTSVETHAGAAISHKTGDFVYDGPYTGHDEWEEVQSFSQQFVGNVDVPLMLAGAKLEIRTHVGSNRGGSISGNDVSLEGFNSNSTFSNESVVTKDWETRTKYNHIIKCAADIDIACVNTIVYVPLRAYNGEREVAGETRTYELGITGSLGGTIRGNTVSFGGFNQLSNEGSPDGVNIGDAPEGAPPRADNVLPGINDLPTGNNGLFVENISPDRRFLYVSNPKYQRDADDALSTDFMLEKLNNDGSDLLRLGDALYEQELVLDQIMDQTGRALIGDFAKLDDQFSGLMTAGVDVAEDLGLVLGKKLTPEQIASLDQDIVWLEYIQISGVLALAPKVYLSKKTLANSSGGQILANNLKMDVGSFINDGGDVLVSETAVIIAEQDIRNTNGVIQAGDLAIASTAGRIINETTVRREGSADNYRDIAGREASISANNSLLLSGAEGIDIIGASVNSGGNMTLYSENGDIRVASLALESRETEEERYSGLFSSGYERTVTTTQTALTAELSSGGDMNIAAENGAITLVSAKLDSLGGIGMQAQDINSQALALSNSTTYESASSGIGASSSGGIFIGSSTSTRAEYVTQAVGSSINADGLLSVNATNDISLEGGSYNAQAGVFNAGNNFVTTAAQNSSSTSSTSSSAGLSIGNGGIGISANADSANADGRQYDNANLVFENSLAINAGQTADIGGMNASVLNRADAPAEGEPLGGTQDASGVQEDVLVNEPAPIGLDIAALRAAASDDASAFIQNATENGLGFAEFFASVDPTVATGALSIAANDIISTKFQDSYSESSESSGFAVGIQTSSEQTDTSASAGIAVSMQSHSSQESYDLVQDNINVLSGDSVSLSGTDSIDLRGVDIAGESLVSLHSDGDINIAAAEVSESFSSSSQTTGVSLGAGVNANLEHSLEDSAGVSASVNVSAGHESSSESGSLNGHVDSVLSSGGVMQMVSGGDVNWTGVTASADTVVINAENFNSAAYEDSSTYNQTTNVVGVSLTASTDLHEMASDLLSGNGSRHTTLESSGTTQVGNTLVANTAIIDVTDNVTLVGGNYLANDLTVRADTVDMVAAKSTSQEHSTEAGVSLTMDGSAALGGSKAWVSLDSMSGEVDAGTSTSTDHADRTNEGRVNGGKAISDELLSGKTGLSITYREETTSTESYNNANIGFTNLDINTTGKSDNDGHVDIGGANLVAFSGAENSSIAITTGELNTTKYVDTSETTVHDNSTFIGVATEAHSAVVDTYNHENTLNDKVAEGMTTDEGWVAAQRAGDASNLLMGDLAGASASATIRNTDTQSHSASTSENINYISASDINITTTRGDIELNGVEFNAPPVYNEETGQMEAATTPRANSVALNSAGDIRVAAAKSTYEESSTTLYNDVSLTVAGSVGGSGAGVGVEAGYNGNIEQSSLASTTYSNASISGDTVTLSAQNLSLAGANIDAGAVNIDVENDIDITSVQDTQTQTTSRANWGGSAGLNTMTVVSLNGQGGGGESHDNFAVTGQQSGIHAENTLNVDAGGNVTLTGAHLALDEGGAGHVQIGGDLVANQLNDFRDKDGLFAGGGFGVDESGVNANVNLEKVDTVAQRTTQNSTVSGVAVTVGGQVRGDNLNADGALQSEQQTELQNDRIAGVFVNGTGSTAAMRRGTNAASQLGSSASRQVGQVTQRAGEAIQQLRSSSENNSTRPAPLAGAQTPTQAPTQTTTQTTTQTATLYRPLGDGDGQQQTAQTSGHWIGGEPVLQGSTPVEHSYITGTTMNIQHGDSATLAQRADAVANWGATERQIAMDARQALTDTQSPTFQQSSHMVHEQRGDIKRAVDNPELKMDRTDNLALVTVKRPQDGKQEYTELMDLMAQGKEGPLTKEQSALGVQAAAAGHQIMRETRAKDAGKKPIRVDAKREVVDGKTSHPTVTRTGVDLSKDAGTRARGRAGVPVMTGTSGTSSDVVSSHLAAVQRNGTETVESGFNARGLTEQQAKTAVKDMTMAWMRTGEFSQTMKGNIERKLQKDGDKLIDGRSGDETTVQSHSYSEISTAVDLTLSGRSDDAAINRSVADAKNRLAEVKETQTGAKKSAEKKSKIRAFMNFWAGSKEPNSQYDQNVLVVMGDANGKVDKTVMDSAHDLKKKNPDNIVIVYANADGSGFRGDDLSNLSGNVRVNVVGHGSNVRQKNPAKLASMVEAIGKTMNENGERAEIKRVGLVACGTCMDKGDASYGKELTEALYDRGLTPDVAERTHTMQVNEDGTKTSFTGGKQAPKKIVYRARDGEIQRDVFDAKHVDNKVVGSKLSKKRVVVGDDINHVKRQSLSRQVKKPISYSEIQGNKSYVRNRKEFKDPKNSIVILRDKLGKQSPLFKGRQSYSRKGMSREITRIMVEDAIAHPNSMSPEDRIMVEKYKLDKNDLKLQKYGVERTHVNANGQVATQITDYVSNYLAGSYEFRAGMVVHMKKYAIAHGLSDTEVHGIPGTKASRFSDRFKSLSDNLVDLKRHVDTANKVEEKKKWELAMQRAMTAMLQELVPSVADQPGNLRFGRSQHAQHDKADTGGELKVVSNSEQGSLWDGRVVMRRDSKLSLLKREDTLRSGAIKEILLQGAKDDYGDEGIAISSTTRPVHRETNLPTGSSVVSMPVVPMQ